MSWTLASMNLDARMTAMPSPVGVISWPNEETPTQPVPYYAVHFLPATVEPELSGADHEKGTYQVSVFIPATLGIGPALVAAQAVVDWFKRQNLGGVSCGVPTLTTPIQEPDWWHVPVSIPFTVL